MATGQQHKREKRTKVHNITLPRKEKFFHCVKRVKRESKKKKHLCSVPTEISLQKNENYVQKFKT